MAPKLNLDNHCLLSSSASLLKVHWLVLLPTVRPNWFSVNLSQTNISWKLSLQNHLQYCKVHIFQAVQAGILENFGLGMSGTLSQQESVCQGWVWRQWVPAVWHGVWFLLHSSQQASGKTDRERLLSNGSLARCSVSQAIEARLSKYKHLLSLLSYRARVLIINNLAAVCQWHHA